MIENPEKSQLNELTLETHFQETLIRLPYRIGFWVSQSDQTGGKTSDDLELEALESIILSYGEDVCKSEFTQNVMEQTIANYEFWSKWRKNIEDVPNECQSLIYLLSLEVAPKHLDDFKESLFEIAETVALAYRETEQATGFLNQFYIQLRILHKKWDAFSKKYDFSLEHVMNISPSEEEALRQLKGVLRI